MDMSRKTIRRIALQRDWNRLRDDEHDWRIFTQYTFRVALVVLVIIAVSAVSGCVKSSLYLCDVPKISGKFYTNLQSNRYDMVDAWRYDNNNNRRSFMFKRDRFENCAVNRQDHAKT